MHRQGPPLSVGYVLKMPTSSVPVKPAIRRGFPFGGFSLILLSIFGTYRARTRPLKLNMFTNGRPDSKLSIIVH